MTRDTKELKGEGMKSNKTLKRFAIRYDTEVAKIPLRVPDNGFPNYRKEFDDFKDRFAQSIAKRIVNDWDKLVDYQSDVRNGEFIQIASIEINGLDGEYKNEI